MNELAKTITFVCSGLVLLVLAIGAQYITRPRAINDFELVGSEFFEGFEDAQAARSLEIAALDSQSGALREFKVEYKDGLWRIPSHHNYPAEASDRLAQTAASMIGLRREGLVGRRETQFEQLGVVDPTNPEARDPESAGVRITLRDAKDEILADYIIGKKADTITSEADLAMGETQTGQDVYFVRRPDEKETYKSKLSIDVSTRFADWIEPDLLKLESGDLRQLVVDNYTLQQQPVNTPAGIGLQLVKVEGEANKLSRDSSFGAWQLEGLNDQTEELEQFPINDLVGVLDDLEIVGVRPKFQINGQVLLGPDLTLNVPPELRQDRRTLTAAVEQLQTDLEEKGFAIAAADPQGEQIVLVSQKGELVAGTHEGVRYTLNVGEIFLGDQAAIEIGGQEEIIRDPVEENGGETGEETPDLLGPAGTEDGDTETADSKKKSRYLMIRVTFDPQLLGAEPQPPTEPVKLEPPEGYQQYLERTAAARQAASDQKNDAPPRPPAAVADADRVFVDYQAELASYEAARAKYDADQRTYEDELKDYQERKKAGEQKVDELAARFGPWFYVISADNLDKLQLTRGDLVKAKEVDPAAVPDLGRLPEQLDLPPRPSIEFPDSAPPGE